MSSSNNKIGFTCSTFDLFHAGHVSMLKEAKNYCDHLMVGLQTDPTIDRPKKNKPVQSIVERYIQLSACKYVDEIVPYTTEKDLLDFLLTHEDIIDVRFIGEEYKELDYTGKSLCKLLWNDGAKMEVHYNTRKHLFSSSELRERVKVKS